MLTMCSLFYAGCGMNALSGLQSRENTIYCRGDVGLISVAHQAILLLSSVFFVILSRSRNEQLTQLMQLVTNLRRFFELQILRVLHHQPFQFMDLLL